MNKPQLKLQVWDEIEEKNDHISSTSSLDDKSTNINLDLDSNFDDQREVLLKIQ